MNEEPGKETMYKVASFSDKMRAEREWKEEARKEGGNVELHCSVKDAEVQPSPKHSRKTP